MKVLAFKVLALIALMTVATHQYTFDAGDPRPMG